MCHRRRYPKIPAQPSQQASKRHHRSRCSRLTARCAIVSEDTAVASSGCRSSTSQTRLPCACGSAMSGRVVHQHHLCESCGRARIPHASGLQPCSVSGCRRISVNVVDSDASFYRRAHSAKPGLWLLAFRTSRDVDRRGAQANELPGRAGNRCKASFVNGGNDL